MSDNLPLPEVWMQGALPDIPALLQPAAHTLLQAGIEVDLIMKDFPDHLLWDRVAGMASPAFHLQHLAGVINRLFTYAENRQLTDDQLMYLASEGKFNADLTVGLLVTVFKKEVIDAVEKLKKINPGTLSHFRGVGRKQLPSTVIGLLFHTAEHTMRHVGQLLVTVKVLKEKL